MDIADDPEKLIDPNYTLGVLCSKFLEHYGAGAEEIISNICYQRGLVLGVKLVPDQEKRSFETAIKAFVAASEKSKDPAKLLFLDDRKAIVQGTVCPFGLRGRGRKICEVIMTTDKGILEGASGCKIGVTVHRALAEGEEYCQVQFDAT